MSQKQLGQLVGCSQPTIHRIEAGQYVPRGALLITLRKWMQDNGGRIAEACEADE